MSVATPLELDVVAEGRATPRGTAVPMRSRWRMGAEARGLVLVSAILLAFALAL